MESIKINATAGHLTHIPREMDHPMDAALFFAIPVSQQFSHFTFLLPLTVPTHHSPEKAFPKEPLLLRGFYKLPSPLPGHTTTHRHEPAARETALADT